MNFVEEFEYAPDWVKNLAAYMGINPKAFAVHIPGYAGRDRGDVLMKAVKGIAAEDGLIPEMNCVSIWSSRGSDLKNRFGFNPVGAQFAHLYEIIFCE